ncbi:MAG TPA: hypothetical protein VF483_09265 [Gemmatimonadaceae bacterium]
MRRSGIVWYEILMAIVAVGSITTLAIPMSEDQGRQAIASGVLADVDTLRSSVFRFYSDSGYFPAQSGFTKVPDGLVAYLPTGFSFRRTYGTLEYKNWPLSAPFGETTASNIVGVSVVTTDPKVGAAATKRAGDSPKLVVGSQRIFLFFGV